MSNPFQTVGYRIDYGFVWKEFRGDSLVSTRLVWGPDRDGRMISKVDNCTLRYESTTMVTRRRTNEGRGMNTRGKIDRYRPRFKDF